MNSSDDSCSHFARSVSEQEMVYIDRRAEFLVNIDQKSPRGIIAICILNLANVEKKYSDIQWKYGQLQRAFSFYYQKIEITDSLPEALPIWTPTEKEKLVAVMNRIFPS